MIISKGGHGGAAAHEGGGDGVVGLRRSVTMPPLTLLTASIFAPAARSSLRHSGWPNMAALCKALCPN